MLSLSPTYFIHWLHQFSPETLTVFLFVFCIFTIFLLLRLFGAMGLAVYACVAVIAGNIQVLKTTSFSLISHPVALGTVVFSTVFLVSDILTEYYGKRTAQQVVWISFAAMILMTLWMLLTLAFPLPSHSSGHFQAAHDAMAVLFVPTPAIIIASLIAYLTSQFNDIWIFASLSRITQGRMLWLRTLVATLIGAFIDNVIFSSLAWVVFAPQPLSWRVVFYTYILGTYWIRVIISVVGIGVVYGARFVIRKR